VRFVWSASAGGLSGLARASVGGVSAFDVFSVVLVALLAVLGVRAVRSTRAYAVAGTRLFVYPLVALAALGAWRVTGLARADIGRAPASPHVILIGVDSLRSDAVARGDVAALTPHIDQFLSEAIRFDDAITPLARTFPSWLSILTGRHPTVTGARENLLSRDLLTVPPTLGSVLRQQGYQAFYATDEVRFSNIDESYGFDQVIGPRIGALDFLLGSVNDLPLSNLLANTWIGKALFPYTYVNRAAAVTYQPETFVAEVDSRVDFDRPTLLAMHLTLPHWPYRWAGDNAGSPAESLRQPYVYAASVIGVDRQFGQIIDMLERKGALDNAIVVVLSDHGEALGSGADNLLRSSEARQAARGITVNMWGHGNSVLSPGQYRVLLAWRGFGAARLQGSQGPRVTPSSLEDLMPTLLDLLGVPPAGPSDGVSLAAALQTRAGGEEPLADRVRFTESGITVGFTKLGEARVEDIVGRGLLAYELNPANGRVELSHGYLAELMRSKERAALGWDRILAAMPRDDGSHVYVTVPLSGGVPRFLDDRPDALREPQLTALWDALHARYGDEL
jgi:arylsulfatase A-like enzyme